MVLFFELLLFLKGLDCLLVDLDFVAPYLFLYVDQESVLLLCLKESVPLGRVGILVVMDKGRHLGLDVTHIFLRLDFSRNDFFVSLVGKSDFLKRIEFS